MFSKIKKLADKMRKVSAEDAIKLEELIKGHEEGETKEHEEAESKEFEAGEHEEAKEMGKECNECQELAGMPDGLREKILAITEKLDQEGVFEGADQVVLVMIEAAKKMRQVKQGACKK